MRFECLRCGLCCTKILRQFKHFTVGLFLLPEEEAFFDETMPYYGSGIKGRSRPRPEKIVIRQLGIEPCPHYVDNQCRIYDESPLMCRAYPLMVTTIPYLHVEIEENCPEIKKLIKDKRSRMILRDHFSDEIIKASVSLHNKTMELFSSLDLPLWIYDLKTRKWKRLTSNITLKQ